MKFWWYYIIGAILFFHPHLAEQISMLYEQMTGTGTGPWYALDKTDLLDLILHAGLPTVLIILGLRKQFKKNKNPQ